MRNHHDTLDAMTRLYIFVMVLAMVAASFGMGVVVGMQPELFKGINSRDL
jgi:hypothetical protein